MRSGVVLRRVTNAGFERLPGLIARYRFVAGRLESERVWSAGGYRRLLRTQQARPVAVLRDGDRTWWMWRGEVVCERDGLTAGDVRALLEARAAAQQRRLTHAHAVAAKAPAAAQRQWIPREVRRAVWERDGGCCTLCGSAFELQYDHVIPVALGGTSDAANLQILCGDCNRRKGASVA